MANLSRVLTKYRGTRSGSRSGGSPWLKQESEPFGNANPNAFVSQQPDRMTPIDPKKYLQKTRRSR